MDEDIMKDLQDLEDQQENVSQQAEEQSVEEQKMDEQQVQKILSSQNKTISELLRHTQFLAHIQKVEKHINSKIQANDIKASFTKDRKEQASFIHKCNQYAAQIINQINYIVKFVKKSYNKRLPELESIVTNPALYAKSVLQIEQGDRSIFLNFQGESQQSKKKPFSYLSPQQAISLRIAVSSPHDQLSQTEKSKVIAAANEITLLHQHHNLLMIYLESCMQIVAPNLCKLVGSAIASKLISCAGGIDKLSFMPACNIQVMGGNKAANIGLGMLERNHTGIFGEMEIVRNAPKKFQMQLIRMLATNTAKCARADFLGSSQGIQGDKLRQQMLQRFQKVQQEGGLMRVEKPLPIPDLAPKKKRGGKKYRKMKQLYQMSELAKNKNRLKFGQEAQEQIGGGQGLGMLKSGMGKLNIKIKKQNLRVSQKMEKRIDHQKKLGMGMQSTLDLANKQGIELVNPNAVKQYNQRKGTQSYFNREAGFKTILNQKLGK